MMQAQRQLLCLSSPNFLFPSLPPSPFPYHLYFPGRPTNHHHYSLCSAHRAWLVQLSEQVTTAAITAAQPAAEGPIELPSSISSLLSAASDDTGALRTAASVLITGAFTLFLFTTLRRSAKRAKERKLRSRSTKEEAVESLKNASLKVKGKKPPSPDQALLGALIAAAFGLLLYKFTTTVEFNLNNQPLSPNYSVRQITITIRTIINGMCYLATFVFAFNSLGLFLYSGQLAMNYVRASEGETRLNSSYSSQLPDVKSEDQSSDNTQK
ncbi:hypothetical protein C2S51_015501 [Perilla frutescens var. frutescens]|nr:hypothetical protein C2S51_015501 [Perilla frutescens var. frutescens]